MKYLPYFLSVWLISLNMISKYFVSIDHRILLFVAEWNILTRFLFLLVCWLASWTTLYIGSCEHWHNIFGCADVSVVCPFRFIEVHTKLSYICVHNILIFKFWGSNMLFSLLALFYIPLFVYNFSRAIPALLPKLVFLFMMASSKGKGEWNCKEDFLYCRTSSIGKRMRGKYVPNYIQYRELILRIDIFCVWWDGNKGPLGFKCWFTYRQH